MGNEAIDLARQKKIPFRVNRGQEIDFSITVNNSDGTPYNFTGHSAELLVYNSFNKTETSEFEIDVTLSLGIMSFTHDAISRKKEEHVYQLWVTDEAGYRQIWTNGQFLILNREWDHQDGEDTIIISPDGDDIILSISPIGSTHYRGVYTTLSALLAAIPTGNPGDYGDVDSGSGSDIQRYIWDEDEGWVLGSGSGSMTGEEILEAIDVELNPDEGDVIKYVGGEFVAAPDGGGDGWAVTGTTTLTGNVTVDQPTGGSMAIGVNSTSSDLTARMLIEDFFGDNVLRLENTVSSSGERSLVELFPGSVLLQVLDSGNNPTGMQITDGQITFEIDGNPTAFVIDTRTIAGVDLLDNITSGELKTALSLNNVNNTSDAGKPVSTATQTALGLKVPQTRKVNGQALSADVVVPVAIQRTGDTGMRVSNIINAVATSTATFAANSLRAFPLFISKPITVTEIVSEITSLVGSTTYRVGLYTDNNGYPDALISGTDAGTIASDAVAVKTSSFSAVLLNPGLYWIAYNSNGAATHRANGQGNAPCIGALATLGTGAARIGWVVTVAYAALPSTFTAGATGSNSVLPMMVNLTTT